MQTFSKPYRAWLLAVLLVSNALNLADRLGMAAVSQAIKVDLKLTDRVNMRMVGVPEASLDQWANQFVAKGFKIARVDQMESALAKEMRERDGKKPGKPQKEEKIIRRELAAVLTAGTLVDGGMLQDDMSTFCVAIKEIEEKFRAKTGINVRVVAQGTGQALDTGRRGDADVVFVHARSQEEKFLAEGFGVKRFPVMYNDFVLIGPKSDPAGVRAKDIETALKTIKAKEAPFISRGDKSGTHAAELALWKASGIDIEKDHGAWYKAIGQGMGAALNTASASNAYVLADRGTWLSFKNRGDLAIVVEGDVRLFNQYGVILVSPAKHPHVKQELGQAFIDWLVSPEGQKAIADYKINGEQLFFPNATVPGA